MTDATATAHVVQLSVGGVREIEWRGERVRTAIWKHPVSGRVAFRGVNFDGDDQADRSVHGGRDKAVYAYASEDYTYWRDTEALAIEPALFGENITTSGIDLSPLVVGTRVRAGSMLMEVAQPRLPCFKLGLRVGDNTFLRRFQQALRPGAYFRVIEEGDVGVGDAIVVQDVPSHGVTLRMMVQALGDAEMAVALRNVPGLPAFWRDVADRAR